MAILGALLVALVGVIVVAAAIIGFFKFVHWLMVGQFKG